MEVMEDNNKPKVLPCQHTICQACIEGLNHRCPICRRHFSQHSKDLPTNLTLTQLHDIFMIKNMNVMSDRRTCEFCLESAQDISYHCEECGDYFCSNCATQHETSPVHNGHTPTPVAIHICSNHSRRFNMFCLDCNILLCPVCVHQNVCCTGTNRKQLQDIKSDKTEELETLVSRISTEIKENESHPTMSMLKANIKNIQDTKRKLKEHCQRLREKLTHRENELLRQADFWENDAHQQMELKVQFLSQLKETAEAALAGGIEDILLNLPALQAAAPEVSTPNVAITPGMIHFNAEESLNVGHLHNDKDHVFVIEVPYKGCKQNEEATSPGQGHIVMPISHTEGKDWDLRDIVCVSDSIIVTDYRKKVVLLLDKQGQVITDHLNQPTRFKGLFAKHAVELKCPFGITYHPTQDCMVVSDQEAGCLCMLDPKTLCLRKRVQLKQFSPAGLAVMSDGYIVATDVNNKRIGMFDVQGNQLWAWGYCALKQPWYVTVDRENNIYVADWGDKKIVKLSNTGRRLCVWNTEGSPNGLIVYGDKVLVAEYNLPDCVREYSVNGGQGKQLLTWDRYDGFGVIKALTTNEQTLVVIGDHGLRMYNITLDCQTQ